MAYWLSTWYTTYNCIFSTLFKDKKTLDVTRISRPVCDVIATRQETSKQSMADGRGETGEREIIKPPLRSSVSTLFLILTLDLYYFYCEKQKQM